MSELLSHRELRQVNGRLPALAETRFDKVMTSQITLLLSLGFVVIGLIAVWICRPVQESTHHITTVVGPLQRDLSPVNSFPLQVDSPDATQVDPALINNQVVADFQQVTDIALLADSAPEMDNAAEVSDAAVLDVPQVAEGAGGRPIGQGRSKASGIRREQRWLIEFSDSTDQKSYAAMLNFFHIEIGAMYSDGRLVYLGAPGTRNRIRKSDVLADDERLMMLWADGARQTADLALLETAGVQDLDAARIVHFYSPELELQLRRLEIEFDGQPATMIRRTVFSVRNSGERFEFFVVGQELLE